MVKCDMSTFVYNQERSGYHEHTQSFWSWKKRLFFIQISEEIMDIFSSFNNATEEIDKKISKHLIHTPFCYAEYSFENDKYERFSFKF